MEFIVITWFATVVPNRDQYWCRLQKAERGLCIYWCGNKRKGFNWFEKKSKKSCKEEKKFYKT
jgi:hypothetical protein